MECISVPDRNLPSQLPKVKTLKKESNLYHFGAPKPKHLEKFSKFAKNKIKAVKLAVLAAPRNVSAAPHGVLATPCSMLATSRGLLATLRGLSVTQDTHGKSSGGGCTIQFYGLELLRIFRQNKNYYCS